MNNYKVTYLLGAGASYHSIPVVDSLNVRMKIFYDMFFDYYPLNGETTPRAVVGQNKASFYDSFEKVSDFLEKFRPTFDEAIEHRTVDTYARKLFLKKEISKLNDLKRFLALYFAFEQSKEQEKVISSNSAIDWVSSDKETSDKTLNHIRNTLDYRYDVFFASLLNEEMKLPKNVNIISWNYDHQLEMGFQNYSELPLKECQKKLAVYPRESVYPKEEEKSGKIIKLNGSAHQYYDKNKDIYMFQEATDNIFISILKSFSHQALKTREFALNFAWEGRANQINAIELAEEILSNTDELVVIGYSFPYFNRDVDIRLLSKLSSKNQRIKVMVAEDDFEGVEQSLKDILGSGNLKIERHKDLSQFYIPSKFFGDAEINIE